MKELVTNINPLIKGQINDLLRDTTETLLYNAKENGVVYFKSSNPPIITLTDSIKNYDAIVIETVFITGGTYFINPTYIANPEILGAIDNIDNLRNGGCILDVYNTTYQTSTKRIVVCFSTDTSLMLTGVLNDDPNHTDIGIRNIYGIKNKCPVYEQYSTDEVKIGIWINGKDIYRRVIDFGVITIASTDATIEKQYDIPDIDKVINIHGFLEKESINQLCPLPYAHDISNTWIYSLNNNKVIIHNKHSVWADYNFVCVLEYTKK